MPISSFYEFSYYENHAGHKLEFEPESMTFAVGLYSEADNQVSISIITRPATEFIMDHGHHRMPLFIGSDSIGSWLEGEKSAKDCWATLVEAAVDPEFEVHVHDETKQGWQK